MCCSVCNFPYLLDKMRNKKTALCWLIRSVELNLFLLFPGASRLIATVEVAFNTECRNITCTFFLPWLCNSPSFTSEQPCQWVLCKATDNFPGLQSTQYTNTNTPLTGQQSFSEMDFAWEQPEQGEEWEPGWQQGRQGCPSLTRAADPQSPNKSRAGPVVVPGAS